MTTMVDETMRTAGDPPPAPTLSEAPSRSLQHGRARVIGFALTALAAIVGGFVVFLVPLSGLQEHRAQQTLYKSFRGELSAATAPVGPTVIARPVAVLEIPRLGVRQVVVEGTTSGALMHGPGHRRDTVLPGQAGVSVIFGRRTAFGGPFRRIPDLRPGDIVTATTGQTTAPAKYRVTAVRDSRSLVSQPADTTPNELMLVTAAPPLTPTHSTIVTAQLLTAPQPSASAVPSISPTETALSTDASAWQALAWWALLLLVISLAMSWAYLRWSRWPAYVLSTPVLLAVLWNVFENLARLLPNLL